MEVYWAKDSQAYVTPVGEKEVCVAIVSRRSNARVSDVLQEFPKLERHVGSAVYASAERGAVTAMRRLKRVFQGNLALIGDASGTVDAITGQGLCLSFHQAVALVNSFGLGELSGYQREHRRLMRRPMLMGDFMLLLDRRPALRKRLLRALEMSPDLFERMIAAHIGATSIRKVAMAGALVGWQLLTA
jgi:flavin-dependent dehydrogenase